MAKINDVVAYICAIYPIKKELSKDRVTKIVYLADWKFAQNNNQQMTEIRWYFHNYGPYVDDVILAAKEDPRIIVEDTINMYGDPKTLFKINDDYDTKHNLEKFEMKIIKKVIAETQKLYWDEFIQHVYNTYPINVTNRYMELDLVELAKQERL